MKGRVGFFLSRSRASMGALSVIYTCITEETSQNISGTCKTNQTRGNKKQKPTKQNPKTKATASARVGWNVRDASERVKHPKRIHMSNSLK